MHPNSKDRVQGLSCQFQEVNILCVHRRLVTANALGANLSPAFTSDERKRMLIMLRRRHNPSNNTLDLKSLATDPDLGTVFARNRADFFGEIMQIWKNNENTTPSAIELSTNGFASLEIISALTQAFPDLQKLGLGYNLFMTPEALSPWGRELRDLEELDLRGNPFMNTSTTWIDTILQSYPRLTLLNGTTVRTERDAIAERACVLILPPLAPASDNNTNAEIFLQCFFPAYDEDRSNLAGQYYEADSTFQIIIDQHGRSAPGEPPATWEVYSKRQNITKLSFSPPSRTSEASTGPQKIRECWNALPRTRHPNVHSELFRYKYEEQHYYAAQGGLKAYIIIVQGEFLEIVNPIGNITVRRSFDRTFIVERRFNSQYHFRIVSDTLVISPYVGDVRGLTTNPRLASYQQTTISPYLAPAQNYAVGVELPRGFGQSKVGKLNDELIYESSIIALSRKKYLTLKGSAEILHRCCDILSNALRYVDEHRDDRVSLMHS